MLGSNRGAGSNVRPYRTKGQTTKLKDGEGPLASLINMNGLLYGTTSSGGSGDPGKGGYGTVFRLSPSGVEKVIYSFQGGSDGSGPQAGLTAVNGSLYGSTYEGGLSGAGTIFALGPEIQWYMPPPIVRRTLQAVKEQMHKRMLHSIPEQGRWLGQVVRGYF